MVACKVSRNQENLPSCPDRLLSIPPKWKCKYCGFCGNSAPVRCERYTNGFTRPREPTTPPPSRCWRSCCKRDSSSATKTPNHTSIDQPTLGRRLAGEYSTT